MVIRSPKKPSLHLGIIASQSSRDTLHLLIISAAILVEPVQPLLEENIKDAGKQRLFRSHEASRGTYDLLWDNRLVYLFSSAPYPPKKPRIHEAAFALEEKDGLVKIINGSNKILAELEPLNSTLK